PTSSPILRANRSRKGIPPRPASPGMAGTMPPINITTASTPVAPSEKTIGIHSAGRSNALTACARRISTARNARFEISRSSTQRSGLAHHESASRRRRMSLFSRGLVVRSRGGPGRWGGLLLLAQVSSRFLELGELRDELVIAVPLDEV